MVYKSKACKIAIKFIYLKYIQRLNKFKINQQFPFLIKITQT